MSASPPDPQAGGVAVIGLSCRFPGAANAAEFWRNLCAGTESIARLGDAELLAAGVPAHWLRDPNYVKAAPILQDVDRFDAGFFHYSPREATFMDPQHRLFLECAWEALEDAGCAPQQFRGSIGVYAGAGGSLTSYLFAHAEAFREYLGATGSMAHVGNDKDFLASRVSFKLNLRGPSIVVQTACSTSLVAVHLACQGLLMGEADVALAGGVTVRVPHRAGYLYQEGNILSPDGRCRPFSAQAQGTVFGSGVGIVVLKPLARALAERDHVYAVIKASAINNDGGEKISYTASSVDGQVRAMVEALAVADVPPQTVSYVEAHGTATALGDPLEVEALVRAFRGGDARAAYCALGSVKSNVGHLEAAAGVAGLIKTVLALSHRQLPPSLHCDEPNPRIPFESSPFRVQTKLSEWPEGPTPRRACVNSLGIGGTNAFVVVEEAPQLAEVAGLRQARKPAGEIAARDERPWHLLCLSARTEPALRDLAERFEQRLESDPTIAIGDLCFTTNTGRAHLERRLALACRSSAQALDLLQQTGSGLAPAESWTGSVGLDQQPRIAFLFPAAETIHVNVGRQLFETQPTFRKAVERCAGLLQPHLPEPLLPLLYPDHNGSEPFESAPVARAATFAVEFGLAELWKSWGIRPTTLLGQGVGEHVAAVSAGLLSLEDAVRAVGDGVARGVALFRADGRTSRRPDSSSESGWTRQSAREDVAEALADLAREPDVVSLEVGPRSPWPDVGGMKWLPSLAPDRDDGAQLVASLAALYVRGAVVDWTGFDRDYPQRRKLSLPTYPFQRQRYWIESRPVAGEREPEAPVEPALVVPNDTMGFDAAMSREAFPFLVDHQIYGTIVVPGALWVSMVLTALAKRAPRREASVENVEFTRALALNDVAAHAVRLQIEPGDVATFEVSSSPAGREGETSATLHASGALGNLPHHRDKPGGSRASLPARAKALQQLNVESLLRGKQEKTSADLYRRYHELGLSLGPAFRGVRRLWTGAAEVVGEIVVPAPLQDEAADHEFHPVLLDACFQVGMSTAQDFADLFVPWQIERLRLLDRPGGHFYCRATLRSGAIRNQETLTVDLQVLALSGTVLATIEGLTLKRASRKTLLRAPESNGSDALVRSGLRGPDSVVSGPLRTEEPSPRDWLYAVEWKRKDRAPRSISGVSEAGFYLVFTHAGAPGQELARRFRTAGHHCILVHPAGAYQSLANGDFQVHPGVSGDFERLLADVRRTTGRLPRGLVYLWGLAGGPVAHVTAAWRLTQVLKRSGPSDTTLWLTTRGAQPAEKASLASLTSASLWGLARVEDAALRCVCIDLDPATGESDSQFLFEEVFADRDEALRSFRDGERRVARLVRSAGKAALPDGPFQLHQTRAGVLDQFRLVPRRPVAPGPGEVQLEVRATGLNFRDVLNALGVYPGDAGALGMECAGTISAVGPGVVGLAVGDEVVGFARDSFASVVTVPADLMARKPAALRFEQAATIPVSFATAHLGLNRLAQLRPGMSVLIHAAASGVGLAAVQLAQRAGATVFATASAGKWEFLRSQGVTHVMDSRSLAFAGQVMETTAGQGVDVVLNSLAGEYVPRSLAVLAPNGCFLEIGKKDVWTPAQVAQARPDVAYHLIALDHLIEREPAEAGALLRELLPRFETGEWRPLPETVFPIQEAAQAYRTMQQGRHVGKIVVGQVGKIVVGQVATSRLASHLRECRPSAGSASLPQAGSLTGGSQIRQQAGKLAGPGQRGLWQVGNLPHESAPKCVEDPHAEREDYDSFRSDGTYLVTDGIGTPGLAVARWLVDRGVRHLVLQGPRALSALAAANVAALRRDGCQVQVLQVDLEFDDELARVWRSTVAGWPPLRGVIHGAGGLGHVFGGMDPVSDVPAERLQSRLEPKIRATWNLHRFTVGQPVESFVLFSSAAPLLGLSGDVCQAAADGFLGALAEARRRHGLPALCVRFGPLEAHPLPTGEPRPAPWDLRGLAALPLTQALDLLPPLLRQDRAHVAVLRVEWSQFFKTFAGKVPALFAEMPAERRGPRPATAPELRQRLDEAAPEQRLEMLADFLQVQVARLLGMDVARPPDRQTPFMDLGMDSLMTVELRNQLKMDLGSSLQLPSSLAFDHPTINALSRHLAERLCRQNG